MSRLTNLIGFMGVAGGRTHRIAHKATLFMGILKEHWGKGIGTLFFSNLFTWVKTTTITRLELSTAVKNLRAISLYKKVGFEIECVKKNNIYINGVPVDEYQMFLLL
jgi:RimJ/RimL family protein N-acetyltransferase